MEKPSVLNLVMGFLVEKKTPALYALLPYLLLITRKHALKNVLINYCTLQIELFLKVKENFILLQNLEVVL